VTLQALFNKEILMDIVLFYMLLMNDMYYVSVPKVFLMKEGGTSL